MNQSVSPPTKGNGGHQAAASKQSQKVSCRLHRPPIESKDRREQARQRAKEAVLRAQDQAAAAPPKEAPTKVAPVQLPTPKESSPVVLELALVVVDDHDKNNCAWGWVGCDRDSRKIGATINRACWPAAGAIERKDWQAIRWLAALAIVERLAVGGPNKLRLQIWSYLANEVGIKPQCYWDALGIAYRLRNHSLTSGIEQLDLTQPGTEHIFARIELPEVDQ